MRELRQRLAVEPWRRVLLLVDDVGAFTWAPLQPLLRFEGVHVVVTPGHNGPTVAGAAAAVGLKPVQFPLGPLEPLAQVRLFMRRAPRMLYTCDFGLQTPTADAVQPQSSPAELLVLADSPLLLALAGNPRRIVSVAQGLSALSRPHDRAEDPSPGNAKLQSSASDSGDAPAGLGSVRQVRLVRPDGRLRDKWLPRATRMAELLELYRP